MTEIPEHLRQRAEEARLKGERTFANGKPEIPAHLLERSKARLEDAARKAQSIAKDTETLRTVADGAKLIKDGKSFLDKITDIITDVFIPDMVEANRQAEPKPQGWDPALETLLDEEQAIQDLQKLAEWRDQQVAFALGKFRIQLHRIIDVCYDETLNDSNSS